jgi:hypothetical protein
MARISVSERDGRYRVSVRGAPKASDLRRLERACAKALEFEVLPLVVSLDAPPVDAVTRAYLHRLKARGAVIEGVELPPTGAESRRRA